MEAMVDRSIFWLLVILSGALILWLTFKPAKEKTSSVDTIPPVIEQRDAPIKDDRPRGPVIKDEGETRAMVSVKADANILLAEARRRLDVLRQENKDGKRN